MGQDNIKETPISYSEYLEFCKTQIDDAICDCGALKAKTTHSHWCSSLSEPEKSNTFVSIFDLMGDDVDSFFAPYAETKGVPTGDEDGVTYANTGQPFLTADAMNAEYRAWREFLGFPKRDGGSDE